MEYITFGYKMPEVYDILGTEIIIFRENILDFISRHKDINISINAYKRARCSQDPIDIRIEGPADKLLHAMSALFDIYGLPDDTYNPKDVIDIILGQNNNRTSKKAYQLYKNLEQKIKSEEK